MPRRSGSTLPPGDRKRQRLRRAESIHEPDRRAPRRRESRGAELDDESRDVIADHPAVGEAIDRVEQSGMQSGGILGGIFAQRHAQAFGIEEDSFGVFRLGESIAENDYFVARGKLLLNRLE